MSDALRTQEKPIFADWLAEFPLLKRHKGGRRLLRICDPVVFGIELRRFSGRHGPQYRPEFVAQSLVKHWNGFDINRETHDRRHVQLYIDYEDHPKKWPEAARALRAAFPLLTAPDVDEQAMVELYRGELRNRMNGSGGNIPSTWESLIEILKYYGRPEYETERSRLLAYVRETPPVTTTFHHRIMGPPKDGEALRGSA